MTDATSKPSNVRYPDLPQSSFHPTTAVAIPTQTWVEVHSGQHQPQHHFSMATNMDPSTWMQQEYTTDNTRYVLPPSEYNTVTSSWFLQDQHHYPHPPIRSPHMPAQHLGRHTTLPYILDQPDSNAMLMHSHPGSSHNFQGHHLPISTFGHRMDPGANMGDAHHQREPSPRPMVMLIPPTPGDMKGKGKQCEREQEESGYPTYPTSSIPSYPNTKAHVASAPSANAPSANAPSASGPGSLNN